MKEDTRIESYIREGIEELPTWVQDKLVNVVFFVKDSPTEPGANEQLFGLYEGVPLSERGEGPIEMPDTITVYSEPIRSHYEKEEDVRECVINTVWHEVAHFLGHDEWWVEQEERRRGKTK